MVAIRGGESSSFSGPLNRGSRKSLIQIKFENNYGIIEEFRGEKVFLKTFNEESQFRVIA